jgi:hypothetical protein
MFEKTAPATKEGKQHDQDHMAVAAQAGDKF